MKPVKNPALVVAIAFGLLGLLALSPARADPMKCSDVGKACATKCRKAARGPVTVCLTQCGVRASSCQRTGCWDEGSRRYCGMAKR
jgi:hypothetical protein